MPRDGAGLYSLPAGNPVVTNTVIASTWANGTMSDIAAQLNNVLTRDGLLGPTGPFKIQDGTVAAPGLAFNSEPGLGWYRPGAGKVSMAASGTAFMAWDAGSASTYAALYPRAAGDSHLSLFSGPAGAVNFNGVAINQNADGSASIFTTAGGTATRGSLTLDAPNVIATGGIQGDNLVSIHSVTAPQANIAGAVILEDAVERHFFFAYNNWRLSWNKSSGLLSWIFGATTLLKVNSAGDLVINGNGSKPGGGAWSDSSDARVKHDIADYTTGLDAVLALRPRTFKFKPETGREQRDYVGLVYQEADAMPEMQFPSSDKLGDIELDDMGHIDSTPLTYALINAIKTLHERLSHLELHPA